MTPDGDSHKQQTFSFPFDSPEAILKQQVVLDNDPDEMPDSGASLREQQKEGLADSWQEAAAEINGIEERLQQDIVTPLLSPPKRKSRFAVWLRIVAVLAIFLVIAESINTFNQYWSESPVLASIFASFITILLIGIFSIGFGEWRKLTALNQLSERRDTSDRILNGEYADAVDPYCRSMLSTEQQASLADSIDEWSEAKQPHHSDADTLALFDAMVLKRCDEAAMAVVARWSAEAGVLVGASPLAALDLLFIIWRNARMLDAVADCYGVELGFFSRLKLLHMVLFNLAFVGISEVTLDIGFQSLGADIVSKLSGRAAQGMGAGLLSARLGLKAMQVCRPINFTQSTPLPSMVDVSNELKNQILERVRNSN